MAYGREQNRRKSIRLPGYDYAQAGAYFITICTYNRMCLFGEILEHEMALNWAGRIVLECWRDLVNHYPHIETDEFVIMPNHVHGIIVLADELRTSVTTNNVGAGFKPAPTTRLQGGTHYRKLSEHSSLTPLGVSTYTEELPARPYGSAITMNESPATNRKWMPRDNTS